MDLWALVGLDLRLNQRLNQRLNGPMRSSFAVVLYLRIE